MARRSQQGWGEDPGAFIRGPLPAPYTNFDRVQSEAGVDTQCTLGIIRPRGSGDAPCSANHVLRASGAQWHVSAQAQGARATEATTSCSSGAHAKVRKASTRVLLKFALHQPHNAFTSEHLRFWFALALFFASTWEAGHRCKV